MGKESEYGLAEWFWLRASHEAAVKILAGAAVFWRLDWGSGICFQDGSLTQLLAGAFSFLPCEPMHTFLECPDDMIAGSYPEKTERETHHNAFYDLVSEI